MPESRTYHAFGLALATPAGDVSLGIDGDGHLHLFLPMPDGSAVLEDRRSEGVRLCRHDLLIDGVLRVHADLECTLPHLHETFLHLVDEILERMRSTELRADGIARSALSRWRELLGASHRPALSKEGLIGLYGELATLAELIDPQGMLACWSGPLGQRHDFEFDYDALEVKTTRGTGRDCVSINGLWQLHPPVRGELYLRRLRVEESPGGRSVPELVAALLNAGVDRLELLRRLMLMDYSLEQEAQYGDFRLQILDAGLWRVAGSFPRIVAESFVGGNPPPGTELSSYLVDLTSVADGRLPEESWRQLTRTWREARGT
jgi:hypothetical protein